MMHGWVVYIQIPALRSNITLGKLFILSKPQFYYLENEDKTNL